MKVPKQFLIAFMFLLIAILACSSSSNGVEVIEPKISSTESSSSEPIVDVTPTKKPGTARSNPAPVGSEVIADKMSFVILDSTRPADDIIKEGNSFNSMPGDGEEYILIEIQILCLKSSDDKCTISPFKFKLVGNSGIEYDAEMLIAGVTGLLGSEDFYGDAVVKGSLPFIINESDDNVILVYNPFIGDNFYLAVP